MTAFAKTHDILSDIGDATLERLPRYSEEAIALAFADIYSEELRYVAAWGRWLYYDGTRWVTDDTFSAVNRARKVCREFAADAPGSEKAAAGIASASTVFAVERLAKSDPRLAAKVDQWDSDPWLLNTPAGPINLRTGVRYSHLPGRHLTKITAVSPGGDCSLWLKVLDRVTGGDVELQRYLARMFG